MIKLFALRFGYEKACHTTSKVSPLHSTLSIITEQGGLLVSRFTIRSYKNNAIYLKHPEFC